MYADGLGVAKDGKEAVRWCRLAADQGDVDAQCILGAIYADGLVVAKDGKEAVRWYRLAADQGDADAMHKLGAMYANGLGVAKDEKEAARWFRLAADKEDADTQLARDLKDFNGALKRQLEAMQSGEIGFAPQAELNEVAAASTESTPPSTQPATEAAYRPEGCIHRTDRGEWVRSKSEVIIANLLHQLGLGYHYEYPFTGVKATGVRRPDFTFFDE